MGKLITILSHSNDGKISQLFRNRNFESRLGEKHRDSHSYHEAFQRSIGSKGHKRNSRVIVLLLLIFLPFLLGAQATLEITVDSGSATTTCSGFAGLPPLVLWSVTIDDGDAQQENGEEEVVYPYSSLFNCWTDFPNLQFTHNYNCHFFVPEEIEICFSAFENEAFPCDITSDCRVDTCANFIIPTYGTSATYTLALDDNQDSDGEVTFTMDWSGEFIADYNDTPCTAIDFGELTAGAQLGNINESTYLNSCANNNGFASEPFIGTPWTDNRGLWFSFTTPSDVVAPLISVALSSDPENLGDPISLQLGAYEAQNGDCGILSFINSAGSGMTEDDVTLYFSCPQPNTTYYILVDGDFSSPSGAEGYFGVEIQYQTVNQAADEICEAENLGTIPDGSFVNAIFQTNNCATAINDPTPNAFNNDQSVWYQFTAPSSGHVIVSAENHIPLLANEIIDLQLAIYSSSDETCTGILSEFSSQDMASSNNEVLDQQCLEAGQIYWLMVDGAILNNAASFDITITDGGIFPPDVAQSLTICNGTTYSIGTSEYGTDGTYVDVLTAFNGCDSTVTTELFVAPELFLTTSETMPASLDNTLDGSGALTISGGTPPYSILWSNGATTQTIENVLTGNYCVTITDALNCEIEDCVEITFIGAINASATGDELLCNGDADGSIILTASGGDVPYDYNWENEDDDTNGTGTITSEGGNDQFFNLTAGNYSITITGAGGLETIVNTQVTQPAILQSPFIEPVICFGESYMIGTTTYSTAGAISEVLTAANGCDSLVTGMLTILPDNVVNNPVSICFGESYEIGTSSYALSGNYEDTFIDSNGCDSTVMTQLTITDILQPVATENEPASFEDTFDGSAAITISGGTAPYSFVWSNGETTQIINNLLTGNYCVTITDGLGCTAEDCVEVSYIGAIAAIATDDLLTCFGDNNGTINLTASGGTPPYNFNWENINDGLSGSGILTAEGASEILTNLTAGNYSISIVDNGILDVIVTAVVNQPSALPSSQVVETLCFGETIRIGDQEYNTSGPVDEILTAANGCDSIVTGMITILPENTADNPVIICKDASYEIGTSSYTSAGDYVDVLSAMNGCDSIVTTQLTIADELTGNALQDTPATLVDSADGVVAAVANGGIAPYIYIWSNGANTQIISDLLPGNYCVTITDALDCQTENCIELSYIGLINAQIGTDELTCFGDNNGSLELTASLGLPPYNFTWENLDDGLSGNGIIPTSGGSEILTELTAGYYFITINGSAGVPAIIQTTISQPSTLPSEQVIETLCFGESLMIGNIEYNSSGPINEVLTSYEGCDSLVTGMLTILPRNEVANPITICAFETYEIGSNSYTQNGDYEDVFTDNNGCDSIVMTSLTVLEEIIPTLNQETVATGFGMSDASLSIDAIGGTENYTFEWSDGQIGSTATNLEGGTTICVDITDDFGCMAQICEYIAYNIDELLSLEGENPLCNNGDDGIVTVNVGEGMGPYIFEWATVDNSISGAGVIINSNESNAISNLEAGIYNITLSDDNGVSTTQSIEIENPQALASIIIDEVSPSCFDECDGSLVFQITGGVPPYTNQAGNIIENGLAIKDGFCVDNLSDNIFIAFDANGCEVYGVVDFLVPLAIENEIEVINEVNCFGDSDGQAIVTTSISDATYLWDNGETTATAFSLDAGIHTVIVSDATGCSQEESIMINEPSEPVNAILEIVDAIDCHGAATGAINVAVSGPGNEFSFNWNSNIEGENTTDGFVANNLMAGDYEVTVSNENNCTAISSLSISQPDPIDAIIFSEDATCMNNGNSGSVMVDFVAGGTSPYVYSINQNDFITETTFSNLSTGNYEVIVEDMEGCQETYPIFVEAPDELNLNVNPVEQITLGETINLSTQLFDSPNVIYNWSTADSIICMDCDNSISVQPSEYALYTIEVIDTVTTCMETAQIQVRVDVERNVFIPTAFSPNNDGINDVFQIFNDEGITQIKKFMIFDRAGEMLYDRNNIFPGTDDYGWDGRFRTKEMSDGVYVYYIEVEFLDGHMIPYKGDVTLVK